MNIELINYKPHYNNELVICQTCKSDCSQTDDFAYYYCKCRKTCCFINGNDYGFSYITNNSEFCLDDWGSFVHLNLKSFKMGAPIDLQKYCVINKSKEELFKQLILL